MNAPIEMATAYRAGGPVMYSRDHNRTWEPIETVIAGLESPGLRAQGLAFGSGISALAAITEVVMHRTGGPCIVVAPTTPYAGTTGHLRRLADSGRIVLREVDVSDADAVARAADKAALLWLETPTNPAMEICDLAAAAAAGRVAGALVAADNTFATPIVQRPLELGCDLVVHSASKYIGGHSDLLLGLVVTRDEALAAELREARTLTGLMPGTLEAWLAARGVRTLPLRMTAASANAAELARRLEAHPIIARVRYPMLGSDPGHEVAARQMSSGGAIVAIEPGGNSEAERADRADRIVGATRLWTHATSLGGIESTLQRRRSQDFESPLVPAGLIRLSVGCEDIEDLWSDLRSAIDSA